MDSWKVLLLLLLRPRVFRRILHHPAMGIRPTAEMDAELLSHDREEHIEAQLQSLANDVRELEARIADIEAKLAVATERLERAARGIEGIG